MPLSEEDRARLGRRLRALRVEHGFDQRPLAAQIGMSVGTLQNIEHARGRVRYENLERYAAVFETTIDRILHPDRPPVADPRVHDLNREHLDMARRYMRALSAIRKAIELLLSGGPEAEGLADVVVALHKLLFVPGIVDATERLLDFPEVVVELARKLDADPGFEERLRDQL